METLIDMINYILRIYNDIEEDISEIEQEPIEIDFEDDNIEVSGIEEMLEVCEKILALNEIDEELFERIISLLIVHYYTIIVASLGIASIAKEELELIDDAIKSDKDEFIARIANQENDYLILMVNCVFGDSLLYYEDDDMNMQLDDYIDWPSYELVFENYPQESKYIYQKYHPNPSKEKNLYQRYAHRNYWFTKLTNIEINSLDEFITVFHVGRLKISLNTYVIIFLRVILNNIKDENHELFGIIVIYILKYYYLYMLFNNSDTDYLTKISIVINDFDRLTTFTDILNIFANYSVDD